ncbi:MAG: LD-carboxypeptidase [Sporichthyaceae bacterium]|nr:LD-carboxypeptidase [Sporichthyaceae bacterium]
MSLPIVRPGDLVAVIAPSGPVDPAAVATGIELLRSWQLKVTVLPHVLDRAGYLAGADVDRAADFTAAWTDPEVAAVLCARGGYGAQRMVDLVDWARLHTARPKPLVGASDITALHEAVWSQLGVGSYFGPMPATGAVDDPLSAQCLHRTLTAGPHPLTAPDSTALVGGEASGVLVGGTLTLLASGLGTPTGYLPQDAIAFLEDVDEAPYRLDRCLTQLRRAGWFAGVRGVLLGSFLRCGPESAVRDLLAERLGDLGVPVLWGFPAGHGRPQLTMPLGRRVHLDSDAGVLSPI